MLQETRPSLGAREAPAARDGAADGPRALMEERSFISGVAPSAFDSATVMGAIRRNLVGDEPAASTEAARGSWACRAFDVAVALPAIVFIAPLLLVLCALVYLHDGGPPIFSHERIGRGGRRFKCLKFRSMVLNAQERLDQILASDPAARAEWARDHKLRDDPRITPIGRFLRKSSLDELPQLFNVLVGDMGIVGPRPIVQGEVHRYGRHFRHYCAVRPGITGLWQVSGRNDVDYHRRVVMDVCYAKSKCLTVDVKIVLATIPAVLLHRGSY